jgi:hypothetical protein
MSLGTLLSAWAVAAVLAAAAIALIVRPLFVVLADICGGRDRARFWTVYSIVLTVAAPLLVVSTPGLLDAAAASGTTGAVLQRAVFYALIGIIVALLIMGQAVWRPVAAVLRSPSSASRPAGAP